jgi:hypothetical protein
MSFLRREQSEPGNSTGVDRLRTGEKQAEPSRTQNSANAAPDVESKSTADASLGRGDYHEKMEEIRAIHDDDLGMLTYGRAWHLVKELADDWSQGFEWRSRDATERSASTAGSKPTDHRAEQGKAVAPEKSSVCRNWFNSDPDTVRRRQIVLKNPKMRSESLCRVFDKTLSPIPLPRDWSAELDVRTWSEAYKNETGRKRIQKIISTDRKAV